MSLNTTHVEQELVSACEFALKTGGYKLLRQFMDKLNYLSEYANREGCRYDCHTPKGAGTECVLYRDRAPYSFEFIMYCWESHAAEHERLMNGGLIYQGPGQQADGSGPSFTVSLNSGAIGWFVHT